MDIMSYKEKYMNLVKKKPKKVKLTIDDVERKDAWSLNLFGSSEYIFMFDILIPNVEFALNYGYEVWDVE